MKFSRSPQLDFFVSLGLFCAVTIGGYFIFTMEITHPGEGLSEVQTRKSPVPKAYSQKVVQVKNSIQKSVERGPRLRERLREFIGRDLPSLRKRQMKWLTPSRI